VEIGNTSLRISPRRASARLRRHPCAALPLSASFVAIISEGCYSDPSGQETDYTSRWEKEKNRGNEEMAERGNAPYKVTLTEEEKGKLACMIQTCMIQKGGAVYRIKHTQILLK